MPMPPASKGSSNWKLSDASQEGSPKTRLAKGMFFSICGRRVRVQVQVQLYAETIKKEGSRKVIKKRDKDQEKDQEKERTGQRSTCACTYTDSVGGIGSGITCLVLMAGAGC